MEKYGGVLRKSLGGGGGGDGSSATTAATNTTAQMIEGGGEEIVMIMVMTIVVIITSTAAIIVAVIVVIITNVRIVIIISVIPSHRMKHHTSIDNHISGVNVRSQFVRRGRGASRAEHVQGIVAIAKLEQAPLQKVGGRVGPQLRGGEEKWR